MLHYRAREGFLAALPVQKQVELVLPVQKHIEPVKPLYNASNRVLRSTNRPVTYYYSSDSDDESMDNIIAQVQVDGENVDTVPPLIREIDLNEDTEQLDPLAIITLPETQTATANVAYEVVDDLVEQTIDLNNQEPIKAGQIHTTVSGKPKSQCIYCKLWFESKYGLGVHIRYCKSIDRTPQLSIKSS